MLIVGFLHHFEILLLAGNDLQIGLTTYDFSPNSVSFIPSGWIKDIDVTVKFEDFLYSASAGFRNHKKDVLLEDAVVTMLNSLIQTGKVISNRYTLKSLITNWISVILKSYSDFLLDTNEIKSQRKIIQAISN